jgi:hypothetical protein
MRRRSKKGCTRRGAGFDHVPSLINVRLAGDPRCSTDMKIKRPRVSAGPLEVWWAMR